MSDELLTDPLIMRLLAEALDLAGGDPDAAATLVRLRLRQGLPSDEGARTVLGRAVAVAFVTRPPGAANGASARARTPVRRRARGVTC
jgi:hypothetical protein